jgi:peptide/nickel transport system permease protein
LLFRKKTPGSASLSRLTWQRFRRNKPAIFGLAVICLATFVAVAGYLITPDRTPYANDQKPELHIKSPGSSVQMLLVRKNEPPHDQGIFSVMLFGRYDDFISYPYNTFRFSGSDIIITEYTDSGHGGDEAGFNLADVLFALDPTWPVKFDPTAGTLTFRKIGSGVTETRSVGELQRMVNEQLVEKRFLLGTDLLGRDLLSRLLIGTRISLSVGLISVLISVLIGVFLGSVAGYYRGRTDAAIMWLINVVWSIPTLLLVIAITLVLGKGVTQVFIAVGLTMWVGLARVVRGQVLGIREKEFVEAGRALGYSGRRIIFRHILPNVMGAVVVMAADNFAAAILTEAGLSFLGIGAQPPIPSWGEMTNAHRGYILMDRAYLAFIPGMAIMLLVLAFMLVGNGLRDALDTRSSGEPALPNV